MGETQPCTITRMNLRNIILRGKKSKSHKTSIEYNTTFLKLKKKRKQAKISNIVSRGAYVNRKNKTLCCFMSCCFVFKGTVDTFQDHTYFSGGGRGLKERGPLTMARYWEKSTS